MIVEAVGCIWAAITAKSTLLLAFGIDSIVELISAFLLYYRLKVEATDRSTEQIESVERRAGLVSGYLLYALALYVLLSSVFKLVAGGTSEGSYIGIVITLAAAVGMPILARAKINAADQIGSRALRADAMETFTCGYMSWLVLAGLGANALLHWWWLDGMASLVLIPFLIREGREAILGECCCPSDGAEKGNQQSQRGGP